MLSSWPLEIIEIRQTTTGERQRTFFFALRSLPGSLSLPLSGASRWLHELRAPMLDWKSSNALEKKVSPARLDLAELGLERVQRNALCASPRSPSGLAIILRPRREPARKCLSLIQVSRPIEISWQSPARRGRLHQSVLRRLNLTSSVILTSSPVTWLQMARSRACCWTRAPANSFNSSPRIDLAKPHYRQHHRWRMANDDDPV